LTSAVFKEMQKTFAISVLKDTYAICRMSLFEPLPDWILKYSLSSITRTAEDYTVVCPIESIPGGDKAIFEGAWKCLKIHGPLDFNEVGVISSLTGVLSAANISVFVLSTYETDYILIKRMYLEKALQVLSDSGHQIYHD
jgi:hypothetical protein